MITNYATSQMMTLIHSILMSTGELCKKSMVISVAAPSLYLLYKHMQVSDSNFTSYVVCSKCWSLYLTKDVLVQNTDGSYVAYRCSYVSIFLPSHNVEITCYLNLNCFC